MRTDRYIPGREEVPITGLRVSVGEGNRILVRFGSQDRRVEVVVQDERFTEEKEWIPDVGQ